MEQTTNKEPLSSQVSHLTLKTSLYERVLVLSF